MRLEHKIAIVTGGGTGIGEAIAKVFAREGARVAITGRRKDELERVVREIERKGGQALALQGSVTNEQDVQDAVAATLPALCRPCVLHVPFGGHAAPQRPRRATHRPEREEATAEIPRETAPRA